MNIQVFGVVESVVGLTCAVLLIVSGLLQRAGITSLLSPQGAERRPANVRATLLLGAGMALVVGARLPADNHLVWGVLLGLPGLCCIAASLTMLTSLHRQKASSR